MEAVTDAQSGPMWDAQDISDSGERVSHLQKDAFFYAHLSVYELATRYCKDATVLDAGSGSGYGSAHLADNGARQVYGIDISEKSVAFSRYHFPRSNLEFRQMSLDDRLDFPDNYFDVIFSSNTLEHVANVSGFLREACRVLKPTGTVVIAVPPITDDHLQYLNVINPYHLNIWSPRQWYAVLQSYFGEITPHLHGVTKLGWDFTPELFRLAEAGQLTEKSFVFEAANVEDMYRILTMSAVFIAQKPHPAAAQPAPDSPIVFVDESFSRPPGYIAPEVRKRLKKYFQPPGKPLSILIKDAWNVLRKRGPVALAQETAQYIRWRQRTRA